MPHQIPAGFRLAGLHCGIKSDASKPDLTLVASDVPCVAAGVYTQNLVCAAPVVLDRQRTPGDSIRVVVVNSGNANACTGERGMADAKRMAELAGQACGADAEQALVLSTGIIGEYLPMETIARGIAQAVRHLGREEASLRSAAHGMMTTDTVPKTAGRTVPLDGREIHIKGLAKGAAMIGPNMATMLGLVLTDAPLTPTLAQQLLAEAVDESFNCISVEGHTSTNDTVLLLANGAAGGETLRGGELEVFVKALREVCIDLAKAIPADGEGATHLIAIEIHGAADVAGARTIAKTVANSALVKTAITGADPNWGRIVSAAGYAGVPFDPAGVDLRVNGHLLYEKGAPVDFDDQVVSVGIRENRDTLVQLYFQEGDATARFWTTDLTAEYVHLNADYHT